MYEYTIGITEIIPVITKNRVELDCFSKIKLDETTIRPPIN
jgi:hypothetical protein